MKKLKIIVVLFLGILCASPAVALTEKGNSSLAVTFYTEFADGSVIRMPVYRTTTGREIERGYKEYLVRVVRREMRGCRIVTYDEVDLGDMLTEAEIQKMINLGGPQ